MTIFDEIANVRKKISRTQDKLESLRTTATTPKTSVYSDMPRGGGNVSNPIELYIIKSEELTEKLEILKLKLHNLWGKAASQMLTVNVDNQAMQMMYFRFYQGFKWNKCATLLDELYPNNNWNANKCFRKYREVLYKLRRLERKEIV